MHRACNGFIAIIFCATSAATAAAQAQNAGGVKSSPAAANQYRDAVAFQNRGVYDLAADEWQKFLEAHGDDPLAAKAQHYLGVCQLQLKKYDQAIATFQQAIEKRPDQELLPATYLNLGLAQYSAAQGGKPNLFPAAAETLGKLEEKFPKSDTAPQAIFYRAEALYGAGDKPQAARLYARYLNANAKGALRPDALYALGVTEEELGHNRQAAAQYDAFLKEFSSHPLRAEIIMRRGETLFTGKQFKAAAQWFDSAARHPNFGMADYATLRKAASQYEQKDYPAAAATYVGLVEKFPNSSHAAAARLAAGNCLYLAGDLEAARRQLEPLARSGGDAAIEAAHWLARVLIKQGQAEGALKLIDEYVAKAGTAPFAANMLLDKADANYELKPRSKEVPGLFADVAQKYPKSSVAPQAIYMAAFTALGSADYAAAQAYATQFAKDYAASELAPDVQFIRGEAQLQLRDYAQAEKTYSELISAHPNHPDQAQWQLRRALALLLARRHSDVLKAIEPQLATFKSPDQTAEARYLIGVAQYEAGQVEAAAKSLEASVAAQPHWRQADETLLALAAAQHDLRRDKDATATLERLLNDLPDSKLRERARLRLADYAYAGSDYAVARKRYTELLEKSPTSPAAAQAWYGLGWAQLGDKHYAKAAESFSQVIDKFSAHELAPRARYGRATARQLLQQYAEAIKDLDVVIAASRSTQEKSDAQYLKALCLAGMKQFDNAVSLLRAILTADPKYKNADKLRYELAWGLKSSGRDKEAAGEFAGLAEAHPQSSFAPEALYHVAEARYREAKYSEAAKIYRRVLEHNPPREIAEKAQHKLAWAAYQQNDFTAAEKFFNEQLVKHPQGELVADARFMIAEAMFKQNRYQDAWDAYQKTLAAPPASDDFRALAMLHAGQAAAQLGKWQDSARLLEKAQQELPQSVYAPEIMYELGWANQNLGQGDAAIKLYEQVASQTQREVGARARFMLGEILFERKNYKEAVRNFFKVAYGYGYPNSPEPVQKWQASATYESARCFEVMKMLDQAKKSYQELLKRYPSSDKAPLAKTRAQALGA